ncbi:FtsK/SpoIIIE domain-containing protein [Geomicrobium sediminis]|uniref:S-DNA-T family DNA segregation ATPase FtsK/SpoIIIE n=1 Tax=Geomicrobium sediminis TaxID=1347788 RepID=A0ABS2PEP8_9BACL|nr:FtsK/SpoIIIE domain-containing protein [Geomicrobium sediminis]MBM7633809.1 S-DNA-T family DNA segregation ATPase FtsK/SpoIIIE [Geomicrobium sediminis]
MLLELAGLTSVKIGSSVVALGVIGFTKFKSTNQPINDGKKIQQILYSNGCRINDGIKERTIRLHRKRKIADGYEYVFQLPLGIGFEDIESRKQLIEDGLNIKKAEVSLKDYLKLRPNCNFIRDIKRIMNPWHMKAMKEVSLYFDGMMKVRVYDERLPNELHWNDEQHRSKTWSVCVGKEREGVIFHDFEEVAHLIVAGASGYGKSVYLKSMITTLIEQNPDDVEFSLFDLKEGSAFARFKDCKQVKRIVTDPEDAKESLAAIVDDMKRQTANCVANNYEDVREAGIKKRHFVVLDEGGELAQSAPKALEHIKTIARLGRGAGYRLVYGTQYPTNETLPSQVRQNVGARLTFVLQSQVASIATIDEGGAEELPDIKGRGIYKRTKKTIVQVPFMSNAVINEKIAPHVNIRPREGDVNHASQDLCVPTKNRKYPIVIEET